MAAILDDDDAVRRLWSLHPLNSLFVWLANRSDDMLTLRVDLE